MFRCAQATDSPFTIVTRTGPGEAALWLVSPLVALFFTHPFRFPMAIAGLAVIGVVSERWRRRPAHAPAAMRPWKSSCSRIEAKSGSWKAWTRCLGSRRMAFSSNERASSASPPRASIEARR